MEQGDARNTRWHGHPVVARLIRIVIFVVPFLTAMAVAFVLSARLPVASSLSGNLLRWLGIVVVSTFAMAAVDRLARRFLPLSVLLRLTLVFPDQAPSRFAIAMRTGTTAQLRRRLDAAREVPVGETPQEAAERLLELVGLLSHHDRLTRGHSERVRAYSHLIGEEMGLTESELDKLRWAGLLHDVGKTAISTVILNKAGRLTDEEYETIKSHPEEGQTLVAPLAEWLGDSVRAVWEHHERFDGGGYPRGLSGTDISFAARVVSVADSYDVMTSARSYKQPMSAEAARVELATCSGSQFDPVVVRSFLNISLGRLRLMTGPLAWFAQLALFEPSGVVHAGSASIQSGGAASTGSTGATTVGAAASTGSAGVTSTVAATAASVMASTAGFVAAAPPVDQVDTVAVIQTSSDGFDPADLSEPADTVLVLDSDAGTARFSTATTAPVFELSAGANDEPNGASSKENDGSDASASEPAASTSSASRSSGSRPSDTQPTETGAGATTSTTSGSATTTTSTSVPPTTTTTTTSVPPTTTTSVPTTTTTTTTTTSTTTTTTTTTTVLAGPGASRLFLGGDVTNSTTAPPFHHLLAASPPDIPLPNFDTDRDSAPGVLIAKDAAGIDGSDPTKVLKFSGGFLSALEIDGNVHVDLYAAAKDFARKDLDVEVGVYRCGSLDGCRLLGSDTKHFKDADDWKKKKFHIHGVQETIDVGEWIEVRAAVLDSSDDDAWFAFGTESFDSRLDFPD